MNIRRWFNQPWPVDGHIHINEHTSMPTVMRWAKSEKITSLTIHPGVTIGERAFQGCTGLTSVTIHPGATIGERAFWGCEGLTSVTIHPGATIGERAFWGCRGLTSVVIHQGATIRKGAFVFCTSLTSVTIHPRVVIREGAFWGCRGLTSVVITILKDEEKVTWRIRAADIHVDRNIMTFTRAQVPTLFSLARNAVSKKLENNPNLKCDDLKDIMGYQLANDFCCRQCGHRRIYNDYLPRRCFRCNP